RIDAARERKAALARTAASLIGRGELLLLDSGSTPLALVEYLPEDAELTVATNSIDIAAAVLRRADLNLIMIGGAVDPTAGGCVDAGAVQSVARMNVDLAFIGACALSPRRGLSAFGLADATFKRAVVAASARCVVLATTDKLAARAPHRFATLNEIDCIVVEHDLPPEDRAALSNAGASVLTAEPPAQP
ncbi:DeoR/GlpR family DNA-binding transcription regulator, partial [Burkholderia thailandensis]